MEALSPSRTGRQSGSADLARYLRGPHRRHRGALYSFGAVDNLAQSLALLPVGSKSWFGRRDTSDAPDLEYRTCATSSKAGAKAAAERMIGRRETYLNGAA
ncbi:hypothetical protein ACVI1I_004702 [Bradyrhizobium sp. USDA 4459]